MAYDYGKMRRLPVDPRVIEEIQRSPTMSAEQGRGAGFMSGWGGPSHYRVFARLPMEERLVYAAVLEGATTQSEMEIRTGLTSEEVSKGLTYLQKKGLVSVREAV